MEFTWIFVASPPMSAVPSLLSLGRATSDGRETSPCRLRSRTARWRRRGPWCSDVLPYLQWMQSLWNPCPRWFRPQVLCVKLWMSNECNFDAFYLNTASHPLVTVCSRGLQSGDWRSCMGIEALRRIWSACVVGGLRPGPDFVLVIA